MIETELTIKYILKQMQYLGVISIYINDECVWADDVDCSNLSIAEEAEAITANNQQYLKVISRMDLVVKYIVEIVEYHHTIIKFYTVDFYNDRT